MRPPARAAIAGVVDPTADGDRHFSGIITQMVVTYLANSQGQEVVDRVVAEAGLTDIAESLADDGAWFSYRQVRSLLEAVNRVVGPDPLREAAYATRLHDESRAEMTQMLQDFGSPANLLRSIFSYEPGRGRPSAWARSWSTAGLRLGRASGS